MRIPELVLAGPDSIVASIPYVIGFTPHDSLVLMWLRDSQVRLTMRLDLPAQDDAPQGWVDAVLAHRGLSDEAIVCIVLSPDAQARDDSGELRCAQLVAVLLARLGAAQCRVRDALLIRDDRWWSYLCEEPECCSPRGTRVDPRTAEDVAARFVLAGVARLPDRQAVIATCAPDPAGQQLMSEGLQRARGTRVEDLHGASRAGETLESWRDCCIDSIVRVLLGAGDPSADDEAGALVGLGDVRIRDTVLWEVAHSTAHDSHRAFERAASLLRRAPRGEVAPIGTVTAVLAWLIGDGVRAVAALERVREEDPEYSLAELLHRSITAGLPPSSWLAMMRDLPRETCRHGRSPALRQEGA